MFLREYERGLGIFLGSGCSEKRHLMKKLEEEQLTSGNE